MAVAIHPTAVVEAGAELDEDVRIGPYCVVGREVRLGRGVTLRAHAVIDGRTTLGAGCDVFPFASIGMRPQDLKFAGESSHLVIGRNNTIREHVTIHTGTTGGGLLTQIGNDGLFMVGVHVAHDCRVGNHVIMANNATLGGHVAVGDHAVIGGLAAIHQFVRIGAHAMIGGMTGVERDVIPFGLVVGERGHLIGLNLVGLKRRGFTREEIDGLRSAYGRLFESGGELAQRVDEVAAESAGLAAVTELVAFLRTGSDRKILKPKLADAA